MQYSARAIRALGHPMSLIAIGLLLINDHLLKQLLGNAVTGKLSDIAGLAFFPLLIAAVVGPVAKGRTAVVSVVLTGVWFTAIKTSPIAAAHTEALVENLTGSRSRITVDPTDLVALPSMALALAAWRRVPAAASPQLPIRVLAGALAIAATVATSSIEVQGFTRIEAVGDDIVAGTYFEVDEVYDEAEDAWYLADTAQSNGLLSGAVDDEACHPSGLCLRGMPDGSVEESVDGGATWRTAWSYPEGRHEFVSRFGEDRVRVRDIAFLEVGGAPVAYLAMGTDGVLRRNGDGSFDRAIGGRGLSLTDPGSGITFEATLAALVGTVLFVAGAARVSLTEPFLRPRTLLPVGAALLTAAAGSSDEGGLIMAASVPALVIGLLYVLADAAKGLGTRRAASQPAAIPIALLAIGPATAASLYGLAYAWSAGVVKMLSGLYLAGGGLVLIAIAVHSLLARRVAPGGPSAPDTHVEGAPAS